MGKVEYMSSGVKDGIAKRMVHVAEAEIDSRRECGPCAYVGQHYMLLRHPSTPLECSLKVSSRHWFGNIIMPQKVPLVCHLELWDY